MPLLQAQQVPQVATTKLAMVQAARNGETQRRVTLTAFASVVLWELAIAQATT